MTTPLVSVVMPAYGHERFVGPAIESVLAQTLTDWELIVIDDASPDGTWAEVARFQDPRITVDRHRFNRGAHATLNEGLARARGPYVAILNSDDLYHPSRLERLVGYLEQHGVDLVGTEVRLIDAAGTPIEDQAHDWMVWYRGRLDSLRDGTDIGEALLAGNIFVTTSNVLFRRELLARVGGFENLRYAHDYAFLLSAVALDGARVAFLRGAPLLDYRWHGGNTIREDATEVRLESFRVICQHLPLMLPEGGRARVMAALGQLSSLAQPHPEKASTEIPRLTAEVARLLDERSRLLAEIDRLGTEVGRLTAEVGQLVEDRARLSAAVERLHGDLAALRASLSFRLGAALLHPMLFLRGLAGRRG